MNDWFLIRLFFFPSYCSIQTIDIHLKQFFVGLTNARGFVSWIIIPTLKTITHHQAMGKKKHYVDCVYGMVFFFSLLSLLLLLWLLLLGERVEKKKSKVFYILCTLHKSSRGSNEHSQLLIWFVNDSGISLVLLLLLFLFFVFRSDE